MFEFNGNSVVSEGLRHPDIVDREIDRIDVYSKPKWCRVAEQHLTDNMRKQGIVVPIVLWGNARLHSGFLRLKVARQLGLRTVPCIHTASLTLEQMRAFNEVARLEEQGRMVFPDSLREFDARGPLLNL